MENNNYNSKKLNFLTVDEDKIPEWNDQLWINQFNVASEVKDSHLLHELRKEVFQSTVQIVGRGCYHPNEGNIVSLELNTDITRQSKFYSEEINTHDLQGSYGTKIYAVNEDCLAYAHRISRVEDNVSVLNMANRRTPGGGVIEGAGAQEEYLFRCSDYYRSLYQYVDWSFMYHVSRADDSYPLDRNYGGIFTPRVTVFRGLEEDGYPLLTKPWKINMIAVPALFDPRCISFGGEIRVAPDLIEGVKNKMRTILRIAAVNGQKTLVLGAFGCGAFNNPPRHTAELFKEVIEEREFMGVFNRICFAIKEDHNSRGEGNFKPFAEVFGTNED